MSVQGPNDNTRGEPPPELNHSHKVAGTHPGETPPAHVPSGGAVSALPNLSLPPCWPKTQGHRRRQALGSSPSSVEPGLPDPALRVRICNDQVSPGAALPCPLWPASPMPPDASAPSVPGPPTPQHPCVRDQTPGPWNSANLSRIKAKSGAIPAREAHSHRQAGPLAQPQLHKQTLLLHWRQNPALTCGEGI